MREHLPGNDVEQQKNGNGVGTLYASPMGHSMNEFVRELQAIKSDGTVFLSADETRPLIKAIHAQMNDERSAETRASTEGAFSNESAEASAMDFAQRLRSQTEEPCTDLADFKRIMHSAISAAQTGWQARLDSDLATATKVWNDRIGSSIESGAQRAAELVVRSSEEIARQVRETIIARIAEVAKSFTEASSGAEKHLAEVLASFEENVKRGQAALAEVSSLASLADEQAAKLTSLTDNTKEELDRGAAMLEWHSQELIRRARQSMATCSDQMQKAMESTAKETVLRIAAEFEQELRPQVDRSRELLGRLETERHAAEELLATHQNLMGSTAKETVLRIAAEFEQELRPQVDRSRELLRRLETERHAAEVLLGTHQNLMESTAKETVLRIAAEFEQELRPQVDRSRELLGRVEAERHATEVLLGTHQNLMEKSSEQVMLAMQQQLEKVGAEWESRIAELGQSVTTRLLSESSPNVIATSHKAHEFKSEHKTVSRPDYPSAKKAERRGDKRLPIARSLLARPADPKYKEEVAVTSNASRSGIYFTTQAKHYYEGMHLCVIMGYAPNDPCNKESFAEIVRVEQLSNGCWGVGLHILIR